MNELLVIGGTSYDVTQKKLQYAIDTQFNYFKFPPRIKSEVANDVINLDDVFDDVDIVTGRYTVSETAGIPSIEGSEKMVYRAGDFEEVNASQFYALPDLNPVGYKMIRGTLDKQDHGGWVVPTILDMGLPLSGESFIKPNKFIVTPEHIDSGENIFFKIQVAIRVSLADAWLDLQKSEDPANEFTQLNALLNAEVNSSLIMPIPGYSNIQQSISAGAPSFSPYFNKSYDSALIQYDGALKDRSFNISNYYRGGGSYSDTSAMSFDPNDPNIKGANAYTIAPAAVSGYLPVESIAPPTDSSIKIQNSVLIELVKRRVDDLPSQSTYSDTEGAYAGTFIQSDAQYSYINYDKEGNVVNNEGQTFASWDPDALQQQQDFIDSKIIGYTETPLGVDLEQYLKDQMKFIADKDAIYKTSLNAYNNMQSQMSDRSTTSQRAQLQDLKIKVDASLNILDGAIAQFKLKQRQLKSDRGTYLANNYNRELPPSYTSKNSDTTGIYRYDVQKMSPVKSNAKTMLYTILYMVDISTAKPFDEYWITTAAGSPYNLIYKRNTTWDIVPQSRLSTIL